MKVNSIWKKIIQFKENDNVLTLDLPHCGYPPLVGSISSLLFVRGNKLKHLIANNSETSASVFSTIPPSHECRGLFTAYFDFEHLIKLITLAGLYFFLV